MEGLTNLKAAMKHFEIQNKALARAINVDPAQISRWLNGKRELKVASEMIGPLADYILSRTLTSRGIDWLKKAFAADGFSTDFETISQLKRTLILWLASDGAEFKRFKSGMDENLRSGVVFREIISRERLERIAAEKCCRMPGVYFLEKGVLDLDAAGCIAILEGYIDYLKNFSNFNLMIADGITAINPDSCWHLKQNRHVTINAWDKQEPTLIYSDQLILTHEFQTHFNNLWMRKSYSLGVRDKTIETLEHILAKLRLQS